MDFSLPTLPDEKADVKELRQFCGQTYMMLRTVYEQLGMIDNPVLYSSTMADFQHAVHNVREHALTMKEMLVRLEKIEQRIVQLERCYEVVSEHDMEKQAKEYEHREAVRLLQASPDDEHVDYNRNY